MNNRIMTAMSGGVDSSVAVYLLKNQGLEVSGVTFLMIDCASDCIGSARSSAEKMGIAHYSFDLREEFGKNVIGEFIGAYESGLTPNPCVLCNRTMKFPQLFRAADEHDCYYGATGHYVRSEFDSNTGRWLLKKAVDNRKDQSYVLYSLKQEQLARMKFPLGEMTKPHIREIAAELGLECANKPDSQDICFVPDGDYAGFIGRTAGKSYPDGDYIDKDGNIIGRHKGQIHYTIGQRKGLGMSFGRHMFVLGKNASENTVTLGDEKDLFTSRVYARNINFIAADSIKSPVRVSAKIRYSQHESEAIVEQTGENEMVLNFDEPQRAVTSGQSVVLYDGDTVVGGGIII